MITFKQLELLKNNAPNISLEQYTHPSTFFQTFLFHLIEFFEQFGHTFQLSEPLFEEDIDESLVVNTLVNGEDFGQFYFLLDDFSDDITLFFYSEEFSHKCFLLENELFEDITIESYHFWFISLQGIHESYLEDRLSRNKETKDT